MDELLRQNVEAVRQRLSAASEGRYPVPKLIAVTKTHPVSAFLDLPKLGITEIGENRVQEVTEKWPEIKDTFQVHLIGRLQTNKVKAAMDKVVMIHSVDRLSLAEEINRRAIQMDRRMKCLIQVSPAGEEQKGGIAPEEVRTLLRSVAPMEGIQVEGLMAVMPNTPDQEYLDKLFASMRTLFEQLRAEAIDHIAMNELSMGMSHDYELAARHGSTMVRLGSALFGARDYSTPKAWREENNGNRGE